MAQTLEFSDNINATEATLTLEITPSADVDVDFRAKEQPVLEIAAAAATDAATPVPELTLSGAPTEAAAAPVPTLVVEPAVPATPAPAAPAPVVAPSASAPTAAPIPVPVPSPAPVAAYAPTAPAATYVAPDGNAYKAQPYVSEPIPVATGLAYDPATGQYSTASLPGFGASQNAQAAFSAPYAPVPGAAPAYAPAPAPVYAAPTEQLYMYPEATIPMTQRDRNLRMFAFIVNLLATVSVGWALLPLAWMIPMTVISWNIYKGTRQSTTLFAILNLIFCNVVSGILLLIAENK